jgi:hypothetical protein
MFKNIIKFYINNLFSIFNLKIVNLESNKPCNLLDKDINPLSAQYYAGNKKVLMNIDLSKCRTNRWFGMSGDSLDPHIFIVNNSIKKNLRGHELYAIILKFLKENQFLGLTKNAAEYLGIDSDLSKKLANYPWWAAVNPWDNRTFEDQLYYYPIEVKKNRAINGMQILSDDHNEIVRDDIDNSLPSHANQYTKLIGQIKKNGFRYGNEFGYVTAELFVANNKFCWKIGDEGNHRATVAAALGIKKIPVLVTKIIRLDELEYWPNVINGIFSKDQATKIFYNIFNAKPSKIYDKWIEKKRNI